MVGYKEVVKNLVASKVEEFIQKRIGHFVYIESDAVMLEIGTKDFNNVTFKINDIKVLNGIIEKKYNVSGYIGDFASVNICVIRYERTYKEYDNVVYDWNNLKTIEYTIVGDDIKTFKFDK